MIKTFFLKSSVRTCSEGIMLSNEHILSYEGLPNRKGSVTVLSINKNLVVNVERFLASMKG